MLKKEYKINEHPITLFDKNMYSEILIIDSKMKVMVYLI